MFGRSAPAIEDQCKSMGLKFIRHDAKVRKVKTIKTKPIKPDGMSEQKVIIHLRKVMLNYTANCNQFDGSLHG
jgi:hypothetical protein